MTAQTIVEILVGVSDPFGPVDQDPDAIREAACRLVAENRVCDPTPPTPPRTADLGGLATIIQGLFLVLFVALVVALFVVAVRAFLRRSPRTQRRRSRRHRRSGRRSSEVEELGPMTVQIDRERDPADWRREADEHRNAGRTREALRCRYRALVGDLARSGVIDEIPGRTTGEERDQFATEVPAGGTTFDEAATLFDGAWYGRRTVDDGDLDVMERLEVQVLAEAARRVKPVLAPSAPSHPVEGQR